MGTYRDTVSKKIHRLVHKEGGRGRGRGRGRERRMGMSQSALTASLLQMASENPSSSAGTGMVCQGKWTLLWLDESTSQAPHSALPRPKNQSLGVEAENATVHVPGVAKAAVTA